MKRILSLILCFVMFLAVVSPLGVTAEGENSETEITNKYKFSGGSGTKDDPYLISTEKDLQDIYGYSVENSKIGDPQVHYKLMNDIDFRETFSVPSYTESGTLMNRAQSLSHVGFFDSWGHHAYRKTGYIVEDFVVGSEDPEKNINSLLSQYGKLYTVIRQVGCDFTLTDAWYYEDRMMLFEISNEEQFSDFLVFYRDFYAFLDHFEWVGGDDLWLEAMKTILYYAPFDDVFDGNGHTIRFEPYTPGPYGGSLIARFGYLFGFIDNGGVVKNLNLEGDDIALACQIGEGGTVENCTVSASKYKRYAYDCRMGFHDPITTIPGKAIAKNYGTVVNCYNTSPNAGMITSDSNVDAKDVFALRLALSGVSEEPEPIRADLNIDSKIDAKDACILTRIVIGCDPRA